MSDPMPTNSPLVGDPYFRFAEFPEWEGGLMVIHLQQFRVSRVTPKGAWIRPSVMCHGKERFVLNGEGRRYAYPTVEAAKASSLIRKRRHIEHLETAMIFARAALKGIQAPEFVPGKPFHDETLDPFHCY